MWQNSIETIMPLAKVIDRSRHGDSNRKYVRPEYREAYDKIPYKDMQYFNLESVLMMKPDLLVGWRSPLRIKDCVLLHFGNREMLMYILQNPH